MGLLQWLYIPQEGICSALTCCSHVKLTEVSLLWMFSKQVHS